MLGEQVVCVSSSPEREQRTSVRVREIRRERRRGIRGEV